jgi:hypothetical protein
MAAAAPQQGCIGRALAGSIRAPQHRACAHRNGEVPGEDGLLVDTGDVILAQ